MGVILTELQVGQWRQRISRPPEVDDRDIFWKPGKARGIVQTAFIHSPETLTVVYGLEALKTETQGYRFRGNL